MIKLKFFSILVFCMVLMGCSTTFQTSKVQNYEWSEGDEDYIAVTQVYTISTDFKINKKYIEFSISGDSVKTHNVEILSMVETKDIKTVETINVYLGRLDNEFNCKVLFYKNRNIIIIFGDEGDTRYQSFFIFGE